MDKQKILEEIRAIADYQFGKASGNALFPFGVRISLSRRTGRIRHARYRGRLLATLRPTDGMLSLTIDGARRLIHAKSLSLQVRVSKQAASFISKGKSAFAKHTVEANAEIRPQDEVIVLDKAGNVLAVGKAVLTGSEMKSFKRGLAVRVRRGVGEKRKKQAKTTFNAASTPTRPAAKELGNC